jgi:outer membrane protein
MKNIFFIALLLIGTTEASAQSNIAHLNSQDVMAAMPSYNEAVQKLDKFQKEVVAELQVMQKDFEENVVIYQDMIKRGESRTLVQVQEEKLIKKERDIQVRDQSAQGEIDAYSRELNYPILTIVEKAVKIVADRHNYLYVFDVSTVMIHNGPDITKEVIKEVLVLENAPPPQEDIKTIIPPPQEVIMEEVTRP